MEVENPATVGGVIPGLVVLGSIKKQTEHASKQHSSMASVCISFCLLDPALLTFLS